MIIKGKMKDVIFLPEHKDEETEIVRLTQLVKDDPEAMFNLKGSKSYEVFDNSIIPHVPYRHEFYITSLKVEGTIPLKTI